MEEVIGSVGWDCRCPELSGEEGRQEEQDGVKTCQSFEGGWGGQEGDEGGGHREQTHYIEAIWGQLG